MIISKEFKTITKLKRWRKWAFSWLWENRKKTFKILIAKTPKWTPPPYDPKQIQLEPEEQEIKKENKNGN